MTIKTFGKNTKFLFDKDGHRTHAVLSIKNYEEILSDLYGLAVTITRRNEDTFSIAVMKKKLSEKSEVSS